MSAPTTHKPPVFHNITRMRVRRDIWEQFTAKASAQYRTGNQQILYMIHQFAAAPVPVCDASEPHKHKKDESYDRRDDNAR